MANKLSTEIPIIGSKGSWLSINAGPDRKELNVTVAFPNAPCNSCTIILRQKTRQIGYGLLNVRKKTQPEEYDTFQINLDFPEGFPRGKYTVKIECGPVMFETEFSYPFGKIK